MALKLKDILLTILVGFALISAFMSITLSMFSVEILVPTISKIVLVLLGLGISAFQTVILAYIGTPIMLEFSDRSKNGFYKQIKQKREEARKKKETDRREKETGKLERAFEAVKTKIWDFILDIKIPYHKEMGTKKYPTKILLGLVIGLGMSGSFILRSVTNTTGLIFCAITSFLIPLIMVLGIIIKDNYEVTEYKKLHPQDATPSQEKGKKCPEVADKEVADAAGSQEEGNEVPATTTITDAPLIQGLLDQIHDEQEIS